MQIQSEVMPWEGEYVTILLMFVWKNAVVEREANKVATSSDQISTAVE